MVSPRLCRASSGLRPDCGCWRRSRRRPAGGMRSAERRRLPMVRVEKEYVFESPDGPTTLAGPFGGSRQLIIQHIMFDPGWDAACPSCANFIDELSDGLLAHLRARETAFALVSRALLAKIEGYRTQRGWTVPWYSSYGSDFNYDFQVTMDQSVPQEQQKYRSAQNLLGGERSGEQPGTSCFLRAGSEIFHTYSTYGRGNEYIPSLYTMLDLTALGRHEAWRSPRAVPQTCTTRSRPSATDLLG